MSNFYYPSSPSSSSSPPSPIASSSSSSSALSLDDDNGHSEDDHPSSSKRRKTSPSDQHDQLEELLPPPPLPNAATCMWTVDPEGKEECGRAFSSLGPFITHVHEDHIGNTRQAYVCEWATCPRKGKIQTSRFALVSHFRSHSGEKPFLCPEPQCDKSFTRSDALAKHMRIQHSINPLLSARNVAQNGGGPTAKHPEREAAPDAVGGRARDRKGEESEREKREEEEWRRMQEEIGLGSKRKKGRSSSDRLVENGGGAAAAGLSTTTTTHNDDPSDSDSDDSFTGPHMPPSSPSHPHSTSNASRPRHVIRYLLGKAIHREAMRERDELELELEGVKAELRRSWSWKERALDAVLKRDLG
ncbi:hypothetical protein BDY24DRAFT_391218 [Mrakia frigida]|uniref:C2H2-type zinc finger protein n=1 Tax=Mrakia frigida TaxID=29902 RepID=UPI003FCC0288